MYRLAQIGLLLLAACFLFAVIMISAALMAALHEGATQHLVILVVAWLVAMAGVVGCFWKSRRLKIKHEDASPLPVPAGPLVLPVRKAGIAVLAGIGILLLWMLGMAAMAPSHLPVEYSLPISLVLALAIVVPPVLRFFTAEYYLRIDQTGLHHYRFGDIPWSDVSGIRIGSVTVKGSTKYHLMMLVKRPDHYAGRIGSWFMFIRRKTLLEKHTLAFPLQMADGNPAFVFEAAIRFRSAVSPPALTGWDGSRDALLPLVRWMQNNPVTFGMDKDGARLGQRIASTMAASYGGWTHLDTLEMAAKRAEMNTLSRAKFELIAAREEKAMADSPPADVAAGQLAVSAAARGAERDFLQSADGRRLAELETQLQTQLATSVRREKWQLAVAVVVLAAFYIGLMWLRHRTAH